MASPICRCIHVNFYSFPVVLGGGVFGGTGGYRGLAPGTTKVLGARRGKTVFPPRNRPRNPHPPHATTLVLTQLMYCPQQTSRKKQCYSRGSQKAKLYMSL